VDVWASGEKLLSLRANILSSAVTKGSGKVDEMHLTSLQSGLRQLGTPRLANENLDSTVTLSPACLAICNSFDLLSLFELREATIMAVNAVVGFSLELTIAT